jgi:hypothetical protein
MEKDESSSEEKDEEEEEEEEEDATSEIALQDLQDDFANRKQWRIDFKYEPKLEWRRGGGGGEVEAREALLH